MTLQLTDSMCTKDKVVHDLKRDVRSRQREVLSKPRITVKRFAKMSNFTKSTTSKKKPEQHILRSYELVIDAVARGVNESTYVGFNRQTSDVNNGCPQVKVDGKAKNINKIGTNCDNDKTISRKENTVRETYYCSVDNIQKESTAESSKQPDPLASSQEEKDNNESIYCELCNETFANGVLFCLHSIKHNENKKYSCHVCEYKTISNRCIEKHVQAHEGKSRYSCEICKKIFSKSAQAIDHKYVHTGEKPFVCDICGAACASQCTFRRHRRYHHWKVLGLSPVKYDCKHCSRSFAGFTSRARHINREHTKDLDVSELCDTCGKRLSSKQALKFHKRIHSGYKPHACNICDKSFCKKELLTEHMRVHSGEKPFKCKHCSKGFSQSSSLRIHERIHTGERPYICRLCKKGFISKGVLDIHLKRCDGISEDSD